MDTTDKLIALFLVVQIVLIPGIGYLLIDPKDTFDIIVLTVCWFLNVRNLFVVLSWRKDA